MIANLIRVREQPSKRQDNKRRATKKTAAPVDPGSPLDNPQSPLAAFIAMRMRDLEIESITELARRTGVSRNTIYGWLGPNPPSVVETQKVATLARVLECNADALAAIWHGFVQGVDYESDNGDIVRAFVLSMEADGLTREELIQVLDVARAAARVAGRRPGGDK